MPNADFGETKIVYPKTEVSHAPEGYKQFLIDLAHHHFVRRVISTKFGSGTQTRVLGINDHLNVLVEYSDGEHSLIIRLITTANTSGQAKVVENSIKRYIISEIEDKRLIYDVNKEKENILLISLGYSPVIVAETVDALQERDISIDKVYLITTSNEIILDDCIPLIKTVFEHSYQQEQRILITDQCIIRNDDIYSPADNIDLIKKARKVLEKEKGNNIYICVAGGRKTMSAAMALLAQMYQVRSLTHVLVPYNIERKGLIFKLRELFGVKLDYLDCCCIVSLH